MEVLRRVVLVVIRILDRLGLLHLSDDLSRLLLCQALQLQIFQELVELADVVVSFLFGFPLRLLDRSSLRLRELLLPALTGAVAGRALLLLLRGTPGHVVGSSLFLTHLGKLRFCLLLDRACKCGSGSRRCLGHVGLALAGLPLVRLAALGLDSFGFALLDLALLNLRAVGRLRRREVCHGKRGSGRSFAAGQHADLLQVLDGQNHCENLRMALPKSPRLHTDRRAR
mmetsp:Transcript_109404/g.316253  ORF Transcript_109404/g.316253 Transcript_109404/m.316253 type:complete len:227 (-) Transcript_109404:3-683(-)